MAIVSKQTQGLDDKQDESKKTALGPSTPGAPGASPTSRTAQFSTGTQPASGSGRFTNIQSYIQANKPMGEQMTRKVASGVERGLSKSEKEATTQAGQIAQNIAKEKERIGEAATFATQVEQDPTQITGTQPVAQPIGPSALERFQQLYSGQTNADQLQQQAQQAQAKAMLGYGTAGSQIGKLGSEGGRFDLLRQSIKQPGYTAGQQGLDQLLMQTGGQQVLSSKTEQLQKQLGQAEKQLGKTYGSTADKVGIMGEFGEGGLASQAQLAQENLRKTLGETTEKFEKEQAEEAIDIQKRNEAANTALNQFFKQGYETLTPEQKQLIAPMLQAGGLQMGTKTYNVLKDPQAYEKYITKGRTDITSKDVINAQELARIQALQQLGGVKPEDYTYKGVGSTGPEAGLAGQELADAIKSARGQLEQELNKEYSKTLNVGGGGFTSSGTASANFLNLLKLMESGAAGTPGAITSRSAVSPSSSPYYFRTFATDKTPEFGVTSYGSDYGYAAALLQDYIDKLNAAGYYNAGLGGTNSPEGIDTFKVNS